MDQPSTEEMIRTVTAWYSKRIMEVRRNNSGDVDGLDILLSAQRKCVSDQKSLVDMNETEIARLGALYESRYYMLVGYRSSHAK